MNNAAALQAGTAKANQLIRKHLRKCMNNALDDIVTDQHRRMSELPGMTGNTRTSPAGATYIDGMLDEIILAGKTFARPPLRTKLTAEDVYSAGRMRYDGNPQMFRFRAKVNTTTNTSQQDNYEFLESQQDGIGLKIVVTGATEYLGNDKVVESYSYAQMAAKKHFTKMPD